MLNNSMSCDVLTPLSAFLSTNLNSKIDSYNRLGERIVRTLGAPLISVEIHQDQLFENISLACEMFSKFAGYTKEYLVVDSTLYERGKGIRLDLLYTLSNPNLSIQSKLSHTTVSESTSQYLKKPDEVYVASCNIPLTLFLNNSTLSADFKNGIVKNQILDKALFDKLSSLDFNNYFQTLENTYQSTTAYYSTINDIPSSVYISNSSLSAEFPVKINLGYDLNQTQYNNLYSVASSINLINFFDTVTGNTYSYNLISPLPDKVFLSNENLSSTYLNGMPLTSITDTQFDNISSNLSSITFNTFLSSNSISSYLVTDVIYPQVFSSYNILSSTYQNGLSVGQIINSTEYNTITSSISGNFKLTDFFKLSSNSFTHYVDKIELVPNLFINSIYLSAIYPNGIQLNDVLTQTQFQTLTTFFDNSLSAFTFDWESVEDITYYTYQTLDNVPDYFFKNKPVISSVYPNGINKYTIINQSAFNAISANIGFDHSIFFCESVVDSVGSRCDEKCDTTKPTIYDNVFDYDIMDYRKVIAITDFEEGSTSGINTLFTIEQTLAQQTYFSYAMGNYGFDLISWWTVKNWLDTREKVLATKRAYEFDERTQYIRFYPEPTNAVRFYGVLPAYVERPLRDLIKEAWVYKYALALSKITVGTIRGKFGSTTAMGGQIFAQDLLQQGITERDALEQQLYTNAAGLGDADPVSFFIG